MRVASLALPIALLPACRVSAGVGDLVDTVKTTPHASVGGMQRITLPECSDPAPAATGHVVFRLPDGHVYRLAADGSSSPEDISKKLDRIGPGQDGFINTAPDGESLLVVTSRFGCGDQMCLAIVDQNVCQAEVVVVQGLPPQIEGYAALGSGGNLIVYPSEGGPHSIDLFAISRKSAGDPWSTPLLLTKDSPYAYNNQPTVSPDGTHLLWDCGEEPAADAGTNICEVGTDGEDFKVRVPQRAPRGMSTASANHHAAYAPDGSIVFEGTWNGGAEQVWREVPNLAPSLINAETIEESPIVYRFTDDNSPCVLPDGRVVSLWLGREGAHKDGAHKSGHEIKVMDSDGGNQSMLATDVDVVDVGIGCSR